MSATRTQELAVARAAVRAAARLCEDVQSGVAPDALAKKDKSPVTVADFGSQALVCRALADAFPGVAIVGEEDSRELREPDAAPLLERVVGHVRAVAGLAEATTDEVCGWIDLGAAEGGRGTFWTLDPIDGTKGFLRGDHYAIALALVEQGKPTVAALGCPKLQVGGAPRPGALLTAVAGQGTHVEPLFDEAPPRPARASSTTDVVSARFCESVESGHSSHDDAARVAATLGITAEAVRIDSQAKYATVARGDAEIYLRLPTRESYQEKIWDHAAGWLCVVEAGGRVSDVDGKPLDFGLGRALVENRGVVASNAPLHDAVLAALKEVGV